MDEGDGLMKKKEFVSPVWDKTNIWFTLITVVTVAIFAVLMILSFVMTRNSDAHGLVLGMCGVFASLASAFFIAVFIRVLDMKKKQREEIDALTLLTPNLFEVYSAINLFLPQMKAFVTIHSDNTITYPTERIYYSDLSKRDGNRSFIDFDVAFRKADSKINEALEKCISSPVLFQCNNKVINLLTKFRLNGLTHSLYEVQAFRSIADMNTAAYGDIYNDYSSFYECYLELSELIEKEPLNRLQKLSDTDEADYRREIETILPQLPIGAGVVYKGNHRIR